MAAGRTVTGNPLPTRIAPLGADRYDCERLGAKSPVKNSRL